MFIVTIEDPEENEHEFAVEGEDAAGFLEYAALELGLEYDVNETDD